MLLYKGLENDFMEGQVPNVPIGYLMTMKLVTKVLPMIVYLDLSRENVKLSYIEPKTKNGCVLKGNLTKNETKIGFFRVDSLWTVKHIGVGSFNVSGHFRLQRCGVGFSEVKLIFIEEFIKNHYIRRSTRDIVFG